MTTIRFSSENELIDELKRDYSSGEKPHPIPLPGERPMLRISSLAQRNGPIFTKHYLVATMINGRGELLRLDRYCGEWRDDEEDLAKGKLNEILNKVQTICDDLIIDVRGGVIEP
jgi:hypothetical protein